MARTSRKNVSSEADARTRKESRHKTAIYARLSVENSGKDDDGAALETQKEVCKEYIRSCPYLELTKIYEDNGHTGTDFARPGFSGLMEDVKNGSIDCIVVRDLSRFGRNYIETGTYLERIFPKLGIRFISVKEQYDSFLTDGSNESLAIPLQNLINDYYSKDISRKVSAALRVRMEDGTYTWHNPPYGYRLNDERTTIIPIEPYAGYVKEMFRNILEGKPRNQIRKWLTERNIPTGYELTGRGKKQWTITAIRIILNNPAYVGDKVLGKSRSALYMGIKDMRVKDPAEWIVFENDHEPLVSREDFAAVQDILKTQKDELNRKKAATEAERAKVKDYLNGKVFCPDCGGKIRMMRRRNSPHLAYYGGYECLNYRQSHYTVCSQHYCNRDLLYRKIADVIKEQTKAAINYERLLEKLRNSDASRKMKNRMDSEIRSLTIKLKGINNKRARLYEDYAEGILDESEYTFAKSSYDIDCEKLNKALDEATERRDAFIETISEDNRWIRLMKSVGSISELTQELADAVIERVELFEGGDFSLTMKYRDVYELTRRYVEEMGEGA